MGLLLLTDVRVSVIRMPIAFSSWYIIPQAHIPVLSKLLHMAPILTIRYAVYDYVGGTPTSDPSQCTYTDVQIWNINF
jgi:hypothetical protein